MTELVDVKRDDVDLVVSAWAAVMSHVHDVDRLTLAWTDSNDWSTATRFSIVIHPDDRLGDIADQIDPGRAGADEAWDPDIPVIGVDHAGAGGRSTSADVDVSMVPGVVLHLPPAGDDARTVSVLGGDLASAVAPTSDWLLDRLDELIADSDQQLDRTVDALSLLSSDDRSNISGWNDTSYPHDPARPLIDAFDAQVAASPDAVAVVIDGDETTYEVLDRSATVLADELGRRGVRAGDAVVLSVDRSLELAVGLLGILRAGALYVPVDPAYPEDRQAYMIADCNAAVIVVDAANADRLRSKHDAMLVRLDELTSATETKPAPVTRTDATGAPDTPGGGGGYIVYTSGSTGEPKGVHMGHAALTNLVDWQLRRPHFRSGARTLQFSALSFDVSFQEIYSTWASGGCLVMISEADRRASDSLLDALIAGRVERLFLPFVALRALAQTAVRTGRYPVDLREVYTAGEQMQVNDTVRKFFVHLPNCVVENQYGPSETHVCTAHTLAPDPTTWPTLPPIGGPIDNTKLLVLDRFGRQRPVGLPGELFVAGTCLAEGYVGRPEMTAERFLDEPFGDVGSQRCYSTGDLVRWLPDGQLEFLGRRDSQVKLRGFRVEPGEVTSVLSGAPGVERCVAVVRDDVGGGATGARMVGYVVPEDTATFRLTDVKEHLVERLPDYMVPTLWSVIDSLPMTPSGKLDTRALPVPEFERDLLSTPYRAPSGATQHALADLWAELFGVEPIGVDDDFFELGGDSLLAVEMTTALHERLQIDLPISALTSARTIADVDRLVSDVNRDAWRSLVPLRSSGSAKPLFVVHGGSGNVGSFPLLVDALPETQPVYALQWNGLDGTGGARTIEQMARHYLDEIRTVQPTGPYLLAGQCVGGLVAREMAGQLDESGDAVDLLVMYDSPHLRSPAYVRRRTPFFVSQLKRFLASGDERARRASVALRSALRRRVAPSDRELHGTLAMVRAAWRHSPLERDVARRTVFLGSGLSNASEIALAGSWTDDAMGWTHRSGPNFVIHHVDADHNDIPHHPDGSSILRNELEGAAAAGAPVD